MAGSSPGRWVELSLLAGPEAVDAISEVLRSNGSKGVAVERSVHPGADEGFEDVSGAARMVAYLPVDGSTEQLERRIEEGLWHLKAFDLAPISALSRRILDEEDWANAWKEHFHPLRVGKRLVIKPSWRTLEEAGGDVVVDLDPGMAFGTGLHPTTRMVLEAIERTVRPAMSVLDAGTGSGILAIAAAKLGAGSVLAVDTENVAVRVARENVVRNGVEQLVKVEEGSADMMRGTFDLIAANIIASVIADLAPELAGLLRPGGRLIASGIIEERASIVFESFKRAGLEIVESVRSGDWLCCCAQVKTTE